MNASQLLSLPLLAASVWSVANGQYILPSRQQPTPEQVAISRNAASLNLGIAMDRSSYLLGESLRVRISARNSAGTSLTVYDPFVEMGIEVYREGGDRGMVVDGYRLNSADSMAQYSINWAGGLLSLGPGQAVEREFVLTAGEGCPSCRVVYPASLSLPSENGRFRLRYCLTEMPTGCAKVDFGVEPSILVEKAAVKLQLPDVGTDPETKQPYSYDRHMFGLILESNGKRYAVLTRGWTSAAALEVRPGDPVDSDWTRVMGPYDRIAEVGPTAGWLRLASDAQDTVNIQWKESGQVKSYCVDKNFARVEVCAPFALPEAISAPAAPMGPEGGESGTTYQFSAGAATSSDGHDVQYEFNWGDGTRSGWTPKGVNMSFHAWSQPGQYEVTAQARCLTHPSTVSGVSEIKQLTIEGEMIIPPVKPEGPEAGGTGGNSTFKSGGSGSTLNHPQQHKLYWGDGSTSPWLPVGALSASHAWAVPGTYTVTAVARCANHTGVVSNQSEGR